MAIQFTSPTNPNNFFNRGLRSARDYLSGVQQRNAARQPIIPDPGKIQSSTPAVPAGFNYQPPSFGGALQGIKSFLKPSQPLYTGPEEPIMTSAVPGITYGKPVSRLPSQPPTAEELKSRAATFWSPQPNIPLAPQPVAPVSPDLTPAPTPTAPPPPTGQLPPQGAPVLPQIPPTAEQIQQAIPQTSATPSGTAAPLTGGATSGAAGAGAGIQTPLAGGLDPATKKAIEDAEKAVQEANKISAEELTSQEEIDKLLERAERIRQSQILGAQNIQNQPIALDFITGQLRSQENRALAQIGAVASQAEPLEQKLARMQAKRTATLAGSKFALERLDKEAERQRATKPKAPEPFTLSPGEIRYDAQGNVVATGGAKPPSEAAEAKVLEKQDKEVAAQQSAAQSIGLVNNLISGDRYKAISGVLQTGSIPFLGDRTAVGEYDQLQGLLKLGVRSLIKGQGSVSDYEGKILGSAASSLMRTTNESQMRSALLKVRGVLKTNNGQSTEVIVKDKNGKAIGQGLLNGQDIYQAVSDGNTIEYL